MTAAFLEPCPERVRPDKTPFEVFTGAQPNLEHLRVFGSRGYVYIDKSKQSK
ncbi:TPA: hypothetical protein N0F65_010197 [Lagenidium giganteum]|uniref:Uncharacterized protein n=1 Tax=Lagenidium giganteum TaxID=4803 RepID=A0AAV2YK27_9STRA|nr:TPA: hypothetical protein N0F65_010197 [Lagenidium giganteum]